MRTGASASTGARRRRPALLRGIAAFLVGSVVAWSSPATADGPEVQVAVVAEVQDLTGWLGFHQEVVATAPESAKPLRLSLPGGTGGNRWLRVDEPAFGAQIMAADGSRAVKVGISGKVVGVEAQRSLIQFEQAALEVQAGLVANQLTLVYGLAGVSGRLLELHLTRR